MVVKCFFMYIIVVLPIVQGNPLHTDVTSKSASPGDIFELILNVVNFANDIKKKLTEPSSPSTVINVREGVERATKAIENARIKRSTRDPMSVGVDVSDEGSGGKVLLERVVGWALKQSNGGTTNIGEVRNCVQEKEQQLVNVVMDVRQELQKCFSMSHLRGPPESHPSVEQSANLKGHVTEDYSSEEEDYAGDDVNGTVEYDDSTEEPIKVLLTDPKYHLDVDGKTFGLKEEDRIKSEDTKTMGKNNSNITLVLGDDKKLNVDDEDMKTFHRSPEENVQPTGLPGSVSDLGVSTSEDDAGQRKEEGERTPTKTYEDGMKGVATNKTAPPASREKTHTSTETSASRGSPLNVGCAGAAIQEGRQKIDDMVRQINRCFIH